MIAPGSVEPDAEGRRLLDRIEREIDARLPRPDRVPPTLARAMRYSLIPGGKRFRPLLTLAANRALGGEEDLALPAACAIEMIHTYSLIHDDLPAMDDDDLRRGRPTSHRVFGEAVAILAGDALLSLAFQTLAREPPGDAHAGMRHRILEVIAESASAEGIIAGQILDLEAEGRPFDEETLVRIHRHKTGALITACALAGAISAGGSGSALDPFRTYGESVGLAFQIVDDLLDVEGTPERTGKSAGKDARAAKATFPALLGVEPSRRRAADLIERAEAAVRPFGPPARVLETLARAVLERSR